MHPERWSQIEELFERTLERGSSERLAFLRDACGDDTELYDEVRSLLEANQQAGRFMDDTTLAAGHVRGAPAALFPSDDRWVGRTLGVYRLQRVIGHGGMSTVYLGSRIDDEYQSDVAIKIIRQGHDDHHLQRRFLRERQILADLDHPNIAKLHDGGTTEEGVPYFVMELIEGVTLLEYCDREQLGLQARLALFLQVCAAVQGAHRNLIVHRDIKPANILVGADGVPKLLDFGIAKSLDPDAPVEALETTRHGHRLMTPAYASPEQIEGKTITTATDVYALGVVLYELLAGLHPHRLWGDTGRDLEDAILRHPAVQPSAALQQDSRASASSRASGGARAGDGNSASADHRRDDDGATSRRPSLETISRHRGLMARQLIHRLSGDLDTIVLMALRKEPERRYSSVEQLAEDLRRYREGLPVLARKSSLGYRLGKFVGRNKLAVASGVIVALLVVGFGVAMALLATQNARERDLVQAANQREKQLSTRLADVASDLGQALDHLQQEEARRIDAEADKLLLAGKDQEAQQLREDVQQVRDDLAQRARTLDELREALGSSGDWDVDAVRQQIADAALLEQQLIAAKQREQLALNRAAEVEQRQDELERRLAAIEETPDRGGSSPTETRARETAGEVATFQPVAALPSVANSTISGSVPPMGSSAGSAVSARSVAQSQSSPCVFGEETNDQGFLFVRICGGTFTMGSGVADVASFDNEWPEHEVEVSEFWFGKVEITNEQYRRLHTDHPGEANLPATHVRWGQAQKFCEHFGFRLPTEAEWEYTARGGSQMAWFFGNDESTLARYAWYGESSDGEPHRVGQKEPHPWGVYDLYGNVWEWVSDVGAPYEEGRQVDPTGPHPALTPRRFDLVRGNSFDTAPRMQRVVRGGAFDSAPRMLRSANRGQARLATRDRNVGFRCVRPGG